MNGKNARMFIGELWKHLLSAQENIGGIPSDFLEKKKEEIRQRKVRFIGQQNVDNSESYLQQVKMVSIIIFFFTYLFLCKRFLYITL